MTTLTYQPDPTQPEFSEDELDSMRVGEQMQQEEAQLLAGKYQNAEELEKAYVELQQRFSSGERGEPQAEEQPQEEEAQEVVDPETNLMETLWNEAQDEWTEDTLTKLRDADPVDIAQAYLEYRTENQSHKLSQEETGNLYAMVGGEEEYGNMLQWAGTHLDQQQIDLYDSVMQKGDPAACYWAVQALAFRMAETEGWTPQDFLSGSTPQQRADVFRSQAEVVEAMSDPRYDRDPAYRQDIMEKLERSNDLQY